MNRKYKRIFERLRLKKDSEASVTFEYMGEIMHAKFADISENGMGFVVERKPFSIIDYEVLDLKVATTESEFSIPSRVLYSQKLGSSGMQRRYGLHFLAHKNEPVEEFINTSCEPLQRATR